MALVLDAGGLIAFDRGDRRIAALIEEARRRQLNLVTSSACIAQAWRGDPRQALLARLVSGLDERPLDHHASRAIGALCGQARSSDVVDAHLALLCGDADVVVTSDPDDLRHLLGVAGSRATVRSA